MAASAPPAQRWLYGPVPDLLFGCGLLYMAIFAALSLQGPAIRSMQPAYLLPLLVILVSMPHYGGTLIRVYESRADRTQYAIFSVYATLAVFGLFVWGVHSSFVGSLLLTVYLTWSPWHYTGQNYGIAVMFIRRRGIELPAGTKRLLYASFVLSYGIVALVFHTAEGRAVAFNLEASAESIRFLPIGVPASLSGTLIRAVAVGWLVTTLLVVFRLRAAGLRALAPALLLILSQALWFTVPFSLTGLGWESGIEPLDEQSKIGAYVLWVAIAHAAQYLWITSFYAKSAESWRGQLPYLAKTAAAGIAIWTIPVLFFAPGRLGSSSYDTGLALLVASGVNLHHFILDGAIWKLRNLRIGNVLIRSKPPESEHLAITGVRSWARPAVWTACGLSACIALYAFAELDLRYRSALGSGDWAAAASSLDRVAWAGRDSAKNRRKLARLAFESGDIPATIALYQRSLELAPVANHYGELGFVLKGAGDLTSAAAAFRAGLELEPDHAMILLELAQLELARGAPLEAIPHLERLERLYPNHQETRETLARARRAAAGPP